MVTEYTDNQVSLVQRFVDFYRAAPESLTRSAGFIGFSLLSGQERVTMKELIDMGVIEENPLENPCHHSEMYRFTNSIDLGGLIEQGKVVLR